MLARKIVIAASAFAAVLGAGCEKKEEVSFKQAVLPILRESCLACHAPGGQGFAVSGFSVESYDSVMKGTKFARVIVPGSSIESTLVILIEHRADPAINMPRSVDPAKAKHDEFLTQWKQPQRLPPEQIKVIRAWIDQGAKNN